MAKIVGELEVDVWDKVWDKPGQKYVILTEDYEKNIKTTSGADQSSIVRSNTFKPQGYEPKRFDGRLPRS
jgi:hypothetical protein